MAVARPNLNPTLKWLWDMISFYSAEEIVVPTSYTDRVQGVRDVLASDISGLVNSVLDFAVDAALVDYTIECENQPLKEVVGEWFDTINSSLLGRIPVGVHGLAKEYFRERWKGSSFIVLRSIWDNVDIGGVTLNLPVKMWLVDGLSIEVKEAGDTRFIGEEKYYIKINEKDSKRLPADKNELIFIQKPFDSWNSLYSNPFLIQRGLWKNLKTFDLVNKKAEKFVAKALEYLLLFKHGTEALALNGNPNFTYSEEDLKKAKEDLRTVIQDNKTTPGVPIYSTNFDTTFEHLSPDYSSVLKAEIYTGLERRLLAGLGLIDIIEGTSSSRRESLLNPKPFIKEVETGISDFGMLLTDVITTIALRNKGSHPKYFGDKLELELHTTPIKDFVTDNIREHLRSCYDRGQLSERTYVEVLGQVDYDIEVTRRKADKKNDSTMQPHPVSYADIINMKNAEALAKAPKKEIPASKTGPEAKNYKGNTELELTPEEEEEIDKLEVSDEDLETSTIVKRKDGWHVISEKTGKNLGGPYKTRKEAEKRLKQVEWFKHKGEVTNE